MAANIGSKIIKKNSGYTTRPGEWLPLAGGGTGKGYAEACRGWRGPNLLSLADINFLKQCYCRIICMP